MSTCNENKAYEGLHGRVVNRFMENYSQTGSFQLGIKPHMIENSAGEPEVYMLRSDSYVERIYMDSKASVAYSSIKLTISGSELAVCKDRDGRLVLFTASASSIYCMMETEPDSGIFGESFPLRGDFPINSQAVTGLSVRLIDGDIWIGAQVEAGVSSSVVETYVVYGKWEEKDTYLKNSGYAVTGGPCAWLKSDKDILFVVGLNSLVGINASNNSLFRFPKLDKKIRDLSVCHSKEGDFLFAVTDDSGYSAYHQASKGEWVYYDTKEVYVQIESVCDVLGNIWVYALAANGELRYSILNRNATEMLLVGINIYSLANIPTDVFSQSLFCLKKDSQLMTHLIYENDSHAWYEQKIGTTETEHISSNAAYSSEITILDKNDLPQPQCSVWIWSKGSARVLVNGAVCYLGGPNKKVRVETNLFGKINLVQETDMLAVPDIFVSFSQDADGELLQIRQYDDVREKLDNIQAQQLLEARKHDGTYLLLDDYRNEATATTLSQAIGRCTKLARPRVSDGKHKGYSLLTSGQLEGTNTICTEGDDFCWSINKGKNNELVFKEHTPDEAVAVLKGMTDNALRWNPFKFIGDLLKTIAQKTAEVICVFVEKVKDVVMATVEFVVDKIKYCAKCVLNTIQEVYHTLEVIFNEVKVAFKELFEWLGFIFDWGDILRTKRVVTYLVDESVSLLAGVPDLICKKIDPLIASAIKKVDVAFDSIIARLDKNVSIGNCVNGTACGSKAKLTSEQEYSWSNNVVMDRFFDTDMEALTLQANNHMMSVVMNQRTLLDDFVKIVTDFIAPIEKNNSFQKAFEYIGKMLSNPENLFTYGLCSLLEIVKGVVTLALEGAASLIKGLFECLKSILDLFKKILDKEIKLPFLSTLWRKITGEKLTLKEIPCLLISISSTIFFKLTEKKALFENDESVEQFKNSFKAQTILDALENKKRHKVKQAEKSTFLILAVFEGAAASLYYAVSVCLDATPDEMNMFFLTMIALITECVWDITAGILLFWGDYNICDVINFIGTILGFLLDCTWGIISLKDERKTKKKIGQIVTFIYGIIALALAILSIVSHKDEAVSAANIMVSIGVPVVIMSKIGLLDEIKKATKYISTLVVSTLDVIAAFAFPLGIILPYKNN